MIKNWKILILKIYMKFWKFTIFNGKWPFLGTFEQTKFWNKNFLFWPYLATVMSNLQNKTQYRNARKIERYRYVFVFRINVTLASYGENKKFFQKILPKMTKKICIFKISPWSQPDSPNLIEVEWGKAGSINTNKGSDWLYQ